MIALVLLAAADSSDTTRPARVQSHPRLRRAVPPPRLTSELVALSEAATESTVRRPYALEEGSGGAATSQAAVVQPPGSASSSRRILVASLLCIFLGGLGAHHLYLGRNVAALKCLLTFNYFGLGVPLDLLSMRRYVRELGAAEAARAVGDAPPLKAAAPGGKGSKGDAELTRRRVGVFGFIGVLLRFALRMVPQYVFGRWLGTLSARVVGDSVPARELSVWLHALGGAVAVWLSVATAGRPNAAALQIVAAAAAGPLFLEARMISEWPSLTEGSPSVLAAMAAANLPPLLSALGWRPCPVSRCPPRRSRRYALLTLSVGALFWVGVLCGWLLRVAVPVGVDGKLREVNGRTLAAAAMCGLRPDRVAAIVRTQCEPQCIKVHLEAILGSFDRFCLYPNKFNRCFDWDIDGTRWSRVGFTIAQAYKELGVGSFASTSEVRKAYRARVLQDHPDKVQVTTGTGSSPRVAAKRQAEAQARFMRAQRAYETITNAKKPPSITDLQSRGASGGSGRGGGRRGGSN